jgi:hypothetical protein
MESLGQYDSPYKDLYHISKHSHVHNSESEDGRLNNLFNKKTVHTFSILSNNEMKALLLEPQAKWYRRCVSLRFISKWYSSTCLGKHSPYNRSSQQVNQESEMKLGVRTVPSHGTQIWINSL